MNFKRLPRDPKLPSFGAQVRSILEFHSAPGAVLADVAGVSLKTAYSWIHDKCSPPRRCEVLTQEEILEALEDHFQRAAAARAMKPATPAPAKPGAVPAAPSADIPAFE